VTYEIQVEIHRSPPSLTIKKKVIEHRDLEIEKVDENELNRQKRTHIDLPEAQRCFMGHGARSDREHIDE
jgi:hypothetical protein